MKILICETDIELDMGDIFYSCLIMVQMKSNPLPSVYNDTKLCLITKDLIPFEPSLNHSNKHRPGLF